MSNILEFIIKFKDQMSGGITAIGANVDRTFSRIDSRSKSVSQSINGLNARLNDLQRTRDLSLNLRDIKTANREIAALERQRNKLTNAGTGGGGGGALSLMGMAKGFLPLLAIGAASKGIGASVGNAMDRGATNTSLGVLTGSEKTGNKLSGDLAKLSANTILGPGVFKNAQTLLSFGVEAKNIMPVMKMLGDISGGSQDKLDGLALAFANTASAGKLTGQDLLQYVNAGFNPLNEISRTTGKSMGDLRKEMEDGKITVAMVADAMHSATGAGGRFHNMLNKVAETPFGKWEKLKGQLEETSIKFGNMLMPAVSKMLDVAGPALDTVGDVLIKVQQYLEPIAKQYIPVIKQAFNSIKPILKTLADVGGPILEKLGHYTQVIMATLGPIIVNVGNALSAILVPVLKIVGPMLMKILDVMGWIVQKIGYVIEKFTWLFQKVSEGVGWLLDKIAVTTKSKLEVIKDVIKAGVSDDKMAQFFKMAGHVHGSAYVNSLFVQMSRVAAWADSFYGTTAFTQKLSDVKGKMLNTKEAVIKPGGAAGAYNFAGVSMGGGAGSKADKDKVGKDVNGITGGGTRNTYINLGKFQDSINFYVSNAKDGLDQLDAQIENHLLRLLNSAGQ